MAPVNKFALVQFLSLVLVLTLLAGCGGSSRPDPPAPPTPLPLNAQNVNLIFVVSEDLAYQAAGDINPTTANLTNQGLQRSLLMATFLKQKVLGTKNVTGIYALEPMTHLQTASQHPDMVAFETVQQFAMLNQSTLSCVGVDPLYCTQLSPQCVVWVQPGSRRSCYAASWPARLARVSISAIRRGQ